MLRTGGVGDDAEGHPMTEIMIDLPSSIRASNDVGHTAEDLWYQPPPDAGPCGSGVVTEVTDWLAAMIRDQTAHLRVLLTEHASEAIRALNDIFTGDAEIASMFKHYLG